MEGQTILFAVTVFIGALYYFFYEKKTTTITIMNIFGILSVLLILFFGFLNI
jgi:hypothetical protein